MAREILYLSRADVEAVGMPMRDIIDAVDEMFRAKGEGRTEMPPKPGIHPRPDAFIHAMPAYIPGISAAGIKWVSGYPQNPALGLPYISGLIILNDPENGLPLCVMDATWITAQRTGAATAVAARYLASPKSHSVGILACGVQGRSNLEALREIFQIKEVRAYDLNPRIAEKFAHDMATQFRVTIEVAATPERAVKDMDIVVTSGPILKNPKPTVPAGWLKPGAFACPLDFDSYWTPAAFKQARVFTDDLAQLAHYRKEGYFRKTPKASADLGQIAAGTFKVKRKASDRIVCLNLGLALEDMAVAARIHERARKKKLGKFLPL